MDKKKKDKIMRQVRKDRAARRKAALDLDIPQETAKVFKSHKRDKAAKERNTIKEFEDDETNF